MLSSTFRIPFLTAFVSTSGYRKANFVVTSSGILNVTAENTRKFAACHQCLVLSIGIERIDLIKASKAYRLYWVDVHHSNIIKTVISYCTGKRQCIISALTTKGYILNDPTRSDSRQITFTKLPNTLENHLHLLAKQMLFAETEVKAAGWTANIIRKQNPKVLFKRKQVLEIPVFFDRESKPSIISHQAPVISNKKTEIKIRTKDRQGFLASLRCMIIPLNFEEAVCRECLAMHSEALAIRTYLLFYRELQGSAELCIFRSIHKYKDIIANCKQTFCSAIYDWPLDDCEKITYLFPMHQASDDEHNQRKETHSPVVTHEKAKSLEQVRQILNHMAYKSMAKIIERKKYSEEAWTSTHTTNILRLKNRDCIKVQSEENFILRCVGCILKYVRETRVVLVSSRSEALLLTDPSDI